MIGNAKLKLWVSTSQGNDMDIFAGIRKIGADNQIVEFWNQLARHSIASRGWMRVSLRKLDPERSTEAQPVQALNEHQLTEPGQIVPVEIEILPFSVLFEKGSTFELIVKGSEITRSLIAQHMPLVNQRNHNVFAGRDYD